jgi:uncharacterized membrane protein YccC
MDEDLDALRPHPWSALVRLQPGRPAVAVGLRMAVVISVPMMIGASIGRIGPATAVCLGALNAGMADVGGDRRSRWHALMAAMILNAVAIAVGTLAGQSMGAALPLLFIVAFASGMANLFGNVSANVGFVVCVLFMVGVGTPGGGAEALERLWLTALGGAWAIVVVLVLWPVRPFEVAAAAVAECCASLARFLRGLATPVGDGGNGTAPEYTGTPQQVRSRLDEARALLVATRTQRRGDSATGRRLLDELRGAQRLFDLAEGFAASRAMVPSGADTDEVTGAADAILSAAADDLDHVAALTRRIDRGVFPATVPAVQSVTGLTDRLDHARLRADLVSMEEIHTAAAALERMVDTVQDMARALHGPAEDMPADSPGDHAPREEVPSPPRWRTRALADRGRRVVQIVGSNLQFGSVVTRHALRLATTATAGLAIAMGAHLDKGYWVTLTIAVVMRPFAAATMERALLRVAGTVLGAALTAVLVTGVTDHTQLIAAMFVLALLAFSLMPLNYAVGVIFLTPLVIVLISLSTPGGWELALHRIVNTLIGGALALIGGYVLWPTSNRVGLVDSLGVSLDANRTFLGAALDAVGVPRDHRDLGTIEGFHRSAGVALDNLVAGFQQLVGEPAARGEPVDVLWSLTESSRLLFVGAVAIEHQLHVMSDAHDLPEVAAVHRAFDQALQAATAAVRSHGVPTDDGRPAAFGAPHTGAAMTATDALAAAVAGARNRREAELLAGRIAPTPAAMVAQDLTVIDGAARSIAETIDHLDAELAELAAGRDPAATPG